MTRLSSLTAIILCCLFLSSCEFRCSVGDKKNAGVQKEEKKAARVSNDILLDPKNVEIEKAYLLFEDGSRVPDNNVVDFSQAVKLMLAINDGWKETNGKVLLGASEKIEVESGEVLLDEPDLFKSYTDGISADDAKYISLTARVTLKKDIRPLTTFIVSFKVWDKNSDASVSGHYKLYAK